VAPPTGAPGETFVTPGSPQATTPKRKAPTVPKHALTLVMMYNLSFTLIERQTTCAKSAARALLDGAGRQTQGHRLGTAFREK
jgi:hypothetical protein